MCGHQSVKVAGQVEKFMYKNRQVTSDMLVEMISRSWKEYKGDLEESCQGCEPLISEND